MRLKYDSTYETAESRGGDSTERKKILNLKTQYFENFGFKSKSYSYYGAYNFLYLNY